MGFFDSLTQGGGGQGQGANPYFSPGQQGLMALSQQLLQAGQPSRIPVSNAQAFGSGALGFTQAFQGSNARQNVAKAMQGGDLNSVMQAMLTSGDPQLQQMGMQAKLQMMQPDNQIKMAVLQKILGQQGGQQGGQQPGTQPQAAPAGAPAAPPGGGMAPGAIPVYNQPPAAPASPAGASGSWDSDPSTMAALAVVDPKSSEAITNLRKSTYDSPPGKAAATAANEAAKTIAQNDQDIALGNQYIQNINKAISPDPTLGGKSLNEVAPDGAWAHYKAIYEGNAPNAIGGDTQGATAYNQLQSLLIPAAARQSKESFNRVTGMEFNKMLEAQGGLNQPRDARAGVFRQNMQTTAQNIAAKQAQNDKLRAQYNLPPSSVAPAASAPQAPPQLSQKIISNTIMQAKNAIANGKDPAAVKQRLQENGIDPSKYGL